MGMSLSTRIDTSNPDLGSLVSLVHGFWSDMKKWETRCNELQVQMIDRSITPQHLLDMVVPTLQEIFDKHCIYNKQPGRIRGGRSNFGDPIAYDPERDVIESIEKTRKGYHIIVKCIIGIDISYKYEAIQVDSGYKLLDRRTMLCDDENIKTNL